MAVIRVNKTSDYTVMSNAHFREKSMSLKAKGLLSLMLSLPDDWDYSINGLCSICKENATAIRSTLAELEKFGYLIRERSRDENGKFDYVYNIFEKPQIAGQYAEKPHLEKPYAENPHTGNRTQLNTNELNTNESNTDISSIKQERKKESGSFDKMIANYSNGNQEIAELLKEWLKVRKAKRAAMTDKAIELNLNKLDRLAMESRMSVPEYLREVICRGWQAFYPISNYQPRQQQRQQQRQQGNNVFLEMAKEEGLF